MSQDNRSNYQGRPRGAHAAPPSGGAARSQGSRPRVSDPRLSRQGASSAQGGVSLRGGASPQSDRDVPAWGGFPSQGHFPPQGDFSSRSGFSDDGLIKVRRKRRKGRKAVKVALVVLAVLVALAVVGGIALAAWVSSLNSSMGFDNEQERSALMAALKDDERDSSFYMLVLGSDAREGDAGSRSDVIMLVRVDPDTATVDLVSIPRDTMVEIPGHGTQKINAAYAYGGPAGAVEAVSQFAGVPISHYVALHFDELEQLVDMLGGVWVDVPEDIPAGNGGMGFSAGEQKLSGEQALAFARERKNVAGGDFGRTQAQRIVAEAIIKQVLASSPVDLPGIIGEMATCVTTDYSVTDIVSLAQQFQGKSLVMYSAACPSYTFWQDDLVYAGTEYDKWRDMMKRVDAGLDPNDAQAAIPEPQASSEELGAASNARSPRDYESLEAQSDQTTDDVTGSV